jgi:putative transposase
VVRGWERRAIFQDETDRADVVARLGRLVAEGALTVYAWALLPNHAHLLIRTGRRPLARATSMSTRILCVLCALAVKTIHRKGRRERRGSISVLCGKSDMGYVSLRPLRPLR